MTTYYVEGLKCSRCQVTFASLQTASHNTLGSTSYTDGKIVGSMYDEGSPLEVCPHCAAIFWRDTLESQFIKGDSEWFGTADHESTPFSSPIETANILHLVKNALWRNSEEENYLRTRLWWSRNDSQRDRAMPSRALSPEERANLLSRARPKSACFETCRHPARFVVALLMLC